MEIIKRKTNRKIEFADRRAVLAALYAPCKNDFLEYSKIMKETVEKYKDVPLTIHQMTKFEESRVNADESAWEDIPMYEVLGFDKEVSSDNFEQRLRDEFFERFANDDTKIISFINKYNPKYKAVY